jgi:hypothetical protein
MFGSGLDAAKRDRRTDHLRLVLLAVAEFFIPVLDDADHRL